jgi:hypothetical protein
MSACCDGICRLRYMFTACTCFSITNIAYAVDVQQHLVLSQRDEQCKQLSCIRIFGVFT